MIVNGCGKTLNSFAPDELTNFSGNIRLKKTMHKCDWISMKFPDEPLMCTMEYIPLTYELDLMTNSGNEYKFDGIGRFKHNFLERHAFAGLS